MRSIVNKGIKIMSQEGPVMAHLDSTLKDYDAVNIHFFLVHREGQCWERGEAWDVATQASVLKKGQYGR